MRIACLSAHPQHVGTLAAAHVAAFGALQPGWTLADATAELAAHRPDALPSTLLALDEAGDWLGSVSVLDEDHPDIRQYTPWLASLYVRPQARGSGLGALLVARAVARAGALGHGHLHLYCTDALCGYYAALGWEACDRIDLGALQVWVMRVACAVSADGPGIAGRPAVEGGSASVADDIAPVPGAPSRTGPPPADAGSRTVSREMP